MHASSGPYESDKAGSQRTLSVLRRRAPVVLACLLLSPLAAFLISNQQEKQYSASASLLFRDPGFDQKLFGSSILDRSSDPDREAATNVRLVSLDVVASRAGRRLGGIDRSRIADTVTVAPEGQSDVVRVTATHESPRSAARIANVFAEEYIRFRRDADRNKIREAQGILRRQLRAPAQQDGSAPAGSLREQAQQLDVLASLQTGNAELVERAEIPSSPSAPRTQRNTVIGGVLGLLLGLGLAFLIERFDRRIRDPKEVEEIFDRPILGAIPDSRALARTELTHEVLPARDGEAFRMLRANLRYFNIDHDIKSVLVTSAAPADGKSTVSWNLAAAAAGGGGRALLIEADLRHPVLADSLSMQGELGLSTILSGDGALNDVAQQIPVQAGASGRGLRTVDVLLAGSLPPNPADLLESDRMREVISAAEKSYDLVVIDTPPTSVVSDAIPLVNQVGGVIVVVRLAKTSREAAIHLKNQLSHLDAPVLGAVVNAIGSGGEAYGYGYGYAEAYATRSASPVVAFRR